MKKILVIFAHPLSDSFCTKLAEKYIDGAKKNGNEVKKLYLNELKFNPILENGYKKIQELEPDLLKAQEMIKWADHLVFAYPIWWSTPPALLKGFVDRVFLPGFAFKYREGGSMLWDKYLKGKSARLIVTMDSPPLFHKLMAGQPDYKMMKNILNFCGVKPVHKTYFGSVKMSSEQKRGKWLEKIYKIGLKM